MNNLKDAKILVTGGAGFIGSHTCDLLINERPKKILIVDDFSRGSRKNIEEAMASGIVKVIEGDIRDSRFVSKIMVGVDYCFHLAALRITECAQQPRKCIETLINGTFNVAEACVKHEVKKILLASTASVYGMADRFPTEESHHPYNNRTIYGSAKMFNEQLLRSFNNMYGLRYIALRYFNVYGPRMDIHGKYTELLIRWLDCIEADVRPKVYGDGLTSMDFVFVKDVARANVLAMKSDLNDMVFNIASGKETNLNQLLSLFLELTHCDLEPVYQPERKVNPVKRRLASTKLAEKYLRFKAAYTLERGLKELIEWHKGLRK